MSVRFINDWKYLFSKNAIGGRLSAFTFINIAWMNTGLDEEDLKIDGFTIILLGLGLTIQNSP